VIRISATLFLLLPTARASIAPAACVADDDRAEQTQRNDKVVKALAHWLKVYRTGKINFTSKAYLGKKSIALKFGLISPGEAADMTREKELANLLEMAAKLNTREAAHVMLAVAAIGLDRGRIDYEFEMAPSAVRKCADKWLVKLSSDEAREHLAGVARGEIKADKTYGSGMRAAALRYHGLSGKPTACSLLEQQLGAPELPVRLAAVEALGMLAQESSAGALAAALDREQDEAVLSSIVQALGACFAEYLVASEPGDDDEGTNEEDSGSEPPASAGLAVRAAIRALGRTTWRADMQLVHFLGDFRSPETIPALIAILQRFVDHPEDVASGKLSGLLQHRAHETLVGMTGAVFPKDRPDQWYQQWESDREKMLITKSPPVAQLQKAGDTVSVREFCGIPVEGTRVLFVVDLSGSMGFEMQVKVRDAKGIRTQKETRLYYAKQQLKEALGGLPKNCKINLITYNGNPKAQSWSKQLVKATKKNKVRALKFIEEMRADGGTNMWSGLAQGLKMKSLVYADRYESSVDEIFVLSDGAPSVGNIIDPLEILRILTETNRFNNVRINTIFISSPHDQNPDNLSLTPIELMRRMAENNGGRFVEVKG